MGTVAAKHQWDSQPLEVIECGKILGEVKYDGAERCR
jgi:hypothetical protein